MKFSVASDDEYNATHARDRITIWSPPYCSTYEGYGLSLPSGGYMLTTYHGEKIRVECPSPRTDANYAEVDAAVSAAMEQHSIAAKMLEQPVPIAVTVEVLRT